LQQIQNQVSVVNKTLNETLSIRIRTPNLDASQQQMRHDYKLVNYHRIYECEDYSKVPEEHLKKTCEIVAILEKSASRRVVGHIKPMANNTNFFLFSPTDPRLPRMLIPSRKGFFLFG
jgi:hypothetical protein